MLAEAKATMAHEATVSELAGVEAAYEDDEVSFEELLEARRAATPLSGTSLPPRTTSTLRRVGIHTYGDLEKRYASEGSTGMLKIRNFGRRDLVDVVKLLTEKDVPPGQGGW
jgi:DNA-directed RNA polymerase alpha subunit